MITQSATTARDNHRVALLDLARGIAVGAMIIYHLSWDLSWFAFVDWPVAQGPGWSRFAAIIAGSFLFLAGVSLDLAHHKSIRWHSFWRREAVIVAAACLVSAGTYVAFGDSFVRFGILHAIAAASLIAVPFARAPILLTLSTAVLFYTLPNWATSSFFDGALWAWTGLGDPGFPSVDYVPIAPWAGVTLAGVGLARLARSSDGLWQRLRSWKFDTRPGRLTQVAGRHSLLIYLVHQPLLYGLVWLLAQLGPPIDRAAIAFVPSCSKTCQEANVSATLCDAACSCTLDNLKVDNTWSALTQSPDAPDLQSRMNARYAMCLADPGFRLEAGSE